MHTRAMTSVVLLAVLSAGGLLSPHHPAEAAGGGESILYPPGWNMVGGPPGSFLTDAVDVVTYADGVYVTLPDRTTRTCAGYWAYFPEPAVAQLTILGPGSAKPGTTVECHLQKGWNMVGDPFQDVATLPAGTTAYSWTGDLSGYTVVDLIPIAHSVWIYAATPSDITLTAS